MYINCVYNLFNFILLSLFLGCNLIFLGLCVFVIVVMCELVKNLFFFNFMF